MKRSKKLTVLAAVLAVVCAATLLLEQYEEKQEQIQMTDEIVLEILGEDISALAWEYEDESLGFHKHDGLWHYDEDEAFPVSNTSIQAIISRFEAFGAAFIIENVEDYSQYGLKDPVCTLTVTTDEQTYDIRMGDFSKMDQQRYVDIGDGNVYLVSSDPCNLLPEELSDMIAHDEIPLLDTADKITLSGTDNGTILRIENSTDSYSADDIWFYQQDGENLPLDTDLVETYLTSFSYLALSDYVTYNATEEELMDCGLDDPIQTITAEFTSADEHGELTLNDSRTLHIGMNPDELAAAIEAEEAGEEVPDVVKYARMGDSQIIYRLSELDFEYVMAMTYDDLRHQNIFWGDIASVTKIEAALEGNTHILTSVQDEDEETGETIQLWYYNETEVEADALVDSIETLTASTFTEETPVDKEEISLTLHLDNENYPQVQLQFYRYDGTSCLAVVDGESICLVDRSDVMELVEAVQSIVLN